MNKVKNRQKMMDQKMNVRKQMKLKDDKRSCQRAIFAFEKT